MARIGAFGGPSDEYGAPLSYIQPPDNDFAKSLYDPALLDPRLHLTQAQKDDLQAEIDQIYALLELSKTGL